MYKVCRINQYGQAYSSKGLLQFHSEPSDSLVIVMPSLSSAKKYSKAVVRRYPQVICTIEDCETQGIVEVYQNDEYWDLKRKNEKEWAETNNKGNNVVQALFVAAVVVVSIIFGLISHYLGVYELPLWLKLIILPIAAVTTFKLLWWLFPRVC